MCLFRTFVVIGLVSSLVIVSGFTTVSHTTKLQPNTIRTFPLLVSSRNTEPPVNGNTNGASGENSNKAKPTARQHFFTFIPRKAIQIYSDYASRLWRETNTDARKRIANDKVTQSVKNIQHVFRGEEYCDLSNVSKKKRQDLLDACDSILSESEKAVSKENGTKQAAAVATSLEPPKGASPGAPKKKGRSVLFGATMGAGAACWVFSGNYIFTGLFTLMTILGQLEYYRMVMNTGVYPARRVSVIGAASMFLTVRVSSASYCTGVILLPRLTS